VRKLAGVKRVDILVSFFSGSLKRVPMRSWPSKDAFFGTDRWRMPPNVREDGSLTLDGMMRCYREQLEGLGYLPHAPSREIVIRAMPGGPPLYQLGFFSRDPLGYKFWETAIRRDPDGQLALRME
jgi:hypothetical protein